MGTVLRGACFLSPGELGTNRSHKFVKLEKPWAGSGGAQKKARAEQGRNEGDRMKGN